MQPRFHALLVAAMLSATAAVAQDPAALAPDLVRLENERVRVLSPRYAPGQGIGMHDHPARVVVFLTDATLEVTLPDGSTRTLERKAGAVEATPPTKHAVRNVGATTCETIEIELRGPAGLPPLGDAAKEDAAHTVLLLEDERVKVLRTRVAPGESTPLHGHGERVTVLLSGGRMKVAVEGGATTETDFVKGQVSYGPPTRHVATNVSDVLHDAITVELKPGSAAPASPRQAVADTERAFARTMATRDLAAFKTFLSKETVFFSGGKTLRGPEQVVEWWKRFFEGAEAPFSWEPEQVEVLDSGNLALSSGPVKSPQGEVVSTFTSIWRLEAPGTWRIVFDKGCKVCPAPAPKP